MVEIRNRNDFVLGYSINDLGFVLLMTPCVRHDRWANLSECDEKEFTITKHDSLYRCYCPVIIIFSADCLLNNNGYLFHYNVNGHFLFDAAHFGPKSELHSVGLSLKSWVDG